MIDPHISEVVARAVADELAWHWPEAHGVPSAAEITTDIAHAVLNRLRDTRHAVLPLPSPEEPESWHVTDWGGGRVSICYGSPGVRCYLPNANLTVDDARALAAELLAAAAQVTADDCPHDSYSGDEGPIRDLGRPPTRWRCDQCGHTKHEED